MNRMNHMTYLRKSVLDGVTNWVWPKGDDGLWDGPAAEWPEYKRWIVHHIPRRRVVIQAGGACGVYPVMLSMLFQHVYTFEPEKLNFHCLTQNITSADGPIPNITPVNMALGDKTSKVFLRPSMHPTNLGMHRVLAASETDREIPIWQNRLDAFGIEDVDFIMLDVEGWEEQVLRGAWLTLFQQQPLVQTEGASEPLLDLMARAGYEVVERGGYGGREALWKKS